MIRKLSIKLITVVGIFLLSIGLAAAPLAAVEQLPGENGNGSLPESISQCEPVLDGAILKISLECLNDVVMLQTSKSATGWQYAVDSDLDGVGTNPLNLAVGECEPIDNALGTDYEMYGLALWERPEEIWIVVNSNVPLEGQEFEPDNPVALGDIFLNISGKDFKTADQDADQYAIRFTPFNDAGVAGTGVFRNVKAKSVVATNAGFASLAAYEAYVELLCGVPDYGHFDKTQTYYGQDLSLNVIDSGEFLGPIEYLTIGQLQAAGFDLNQFAGEYTIAFRFAKSLIIDVCGVVGGDGTSCLDCNNIPCGPSKLDICNICDGDGKSCLDCLDVPFGTAKIDICGVCDGDGTSCLDCLDVPFGTAVYDECGVCDGDGSSCKEECIEQAATKQEQRQARQVRRSSKVLVERTVRFTQVGERCDGASRKQVRRQAVRLNQRIAKILNEEITQTVLVCTNSICTAESTGVTKRKLNRLVRNLGKVAKRAKTNAISTCQIKDEATTKQKISDDYTQDALSSVKQLPRQKLACTP